MKFNHKKFVRVIKEEQWKSMNYEKHLIGIRAFADEIGIGSSTLSRILNKKKAEINSILKICTWLEQPITNFINK